MSATFYAEMAQLAQELLAEFGTQAQLRRVTAGAYNPATGQAGQPGQSVPERTVTVAVIDYDVKFIDGTLVLAGDKQCFMSVVGADEPALGDLLRWMGKDLKVIAFKMLAPAGISVLYELQLRRP